MQDLSCFGLVWFSHELLICKILSTAHLKAAFQSLPCLGKSVTGERAQSRGRGAPLFVFLACHLLPKELPEVKQFCLPALSVTETSPAFLGKSWAPGSPRKGQLSPPDASQF